MPVEYNGSGLVPAPFVQIQKRYNLDTNGDTLFTEYDITLNGALAKATTPGMGDLLAQQDELKGIFATNGGLLEISDPANTYSLQFNPNVNSITFNEGNWVNLCRYSISLTAVASGEGSSDNLRSKNETWSINEQLNGTIVVTHGAEAVGLLVR